MNIIPHVGKQNYCKIMTLDNLTYLRRVINCHATRLSSPPYCKIWTGVNWSELEWSGLDL